MFPMLQIRFGGLRKFVSRNLALCNFSQLFFGVMAKQALDIWIDQEDFDRSQMMIMRIS